MLLLQQLTISSCLIPQALRAIYYKHYRPSRSVLDPGCNFDEVYHSPTRDNPQVSFQSSQNRLSQLLERDPVLAMLAGRRSKRRISTTRLGCLQRWGFVSAIPNGEHFELLTSRLLLFRGMGFKCIAHGIAWDPAGCYCGYLE